MDEHRKFEAEVAANLAGLGADKDVQALSRIWVREIARHKYAYNFRWLGRPLIQFPQDIVAMQEIVHRVRPDLIIETGVAHGGSLILHASLLALLDLCDAAEAGRACDPRAPSRRVLGVDIDIRAHNRAAIEAHPLAGRIDLVQGSSIDAATIAKVHAAAKGRERILVLLDSNHTQAHVLAELEAYAPLVTRGSYCVVFDTLIEEMPDELSGDRPWGVGDNPMTAVDAYLALLAGPGRKAKDGTPLAFEIDASIDHQLLISAAPRGYLRRI